LFQRGGASRRSQKARGATYPDSVSLHEERGQVPIALTQALIVE
jgi:hypothetical protein